MSITNVGAFLLTFVFLVAGRDLPPEFEKCVRNEKFDKCLVDAVNKALVTLKDGYPDFGIPPLEPLEVNSLAVESGANSPISLKQVLKNVKVHDLIKSSKVIEYNTDLDNYLIVCESKTERVEVIGDYEMSGRILLIPITGKGKGNITLINARIEHRLIGKPVEKDGELYMVLKEYKVDMKPKRVYMYFENLFGDRVLSENMNRFINENWEVVFNGMKGGYSEDFGKVFKDITNKLFENIPMNKIFLK